MRIILNLVFINVLVVTINLYSQSEYYYYKVLWTGRTDPITLNTTEEQEDAIWWAELAQQPINVSKIQNAQFPSECSWDGSYKDAIQEALSQWEGTLEFNFLHGATQSNNYLEIQFAGEDEFRFDDRAKAGRAHVAVKPDSRIKYHCDDTITKFRGIKEKDTQVMLNNSSEFRSYEYQHWTDWNSYPADYEWHVATVVKHELGHCFGLAHNSIYNSVMNDVNCKRGKTCDVQYEDVNAINTLNMFWQEDPTPPTPPTGYEDDLSITDCPENLNQNTNITVQITITDYDPKGNINPENCRLYANSMNGLILLAENDNAELISFHVFQDYWLKVYNYSLNVPVLDNLNYVWIRKSTNNDYVEGIINVYADDINADIKDIFIYSPLIETPTITHCESKNQGVRLAYSANGADYCKIFYDINSGEPYNGTGSTLGNSPIIVSGSAVDTTIYGLTNGTTYYFAIKAFNDHDSTQLSEEVFSTPLTYSGTFAQNETWPGLGNSDTVKITGDVTVPQVFALTIQAGAIIEFPINVNLTINGSIQAIGTDGSRITFTRSGSSGQWDGIFIHDASGAGSDFDYVDVEHSDYGIYLNSTTAGVNIEHANLHDNSIGFTSEYSSPFTIRYSDITDNNYGMWINSRAVSNNINIKNNWIEDNSNHGIYIQSGVNPYFRECYIRQNGGNGLYCYSNVSPYMLGNKGYNHIHDNLLSGVKAAGNSFPKLGTTAQWGYNHIYDNELYDIENYNSSGYITAKKSYWSENGTSCVYLTPDRRYGDVAYCPMLPEGCSDCEDPDIDSYDPIAGEIDYLKNFENSSSDSIYLKAYETELSEQFAAAIDIYKEQIERNPNCTGADFAIRGIVRCLDALERYNDILKILDYYIDTFPNTKTEIAAKDVSLPLLIYQDQFELAITRVNALLQNSPKNSVSAVFYKLLLADTYEKRSSGKSGQDRSLSAMYFQTVAN